MEEDDLPDNFDQAYNWFSQQYSAQKVQEQQIADPLLNDNEQSAFSSFLDNVLVDPKHASEPFEQRWSEKDFYKGFTEMTEQPANDAQYRQYMAQQSYMHQALYVQQKPFKMHTMALPHHGAPQTATPVGYPAYGHLGVVPGPAAVGPPAANMGTNVDTRGAPGGVVGAPTGYPLGLVGHAHSHPLKVSAHARTAPQSRAHTPGALAMVQAPSAPSLPLVPSAHSPQGYPKVSAHPDHPTGLPSALPGHPGHPTGHPTGHSTPHPTPHPGRSPAPQKDFKVKKREFLSENQVRQNHVSSEKRRRDLIAQHFKAMCAMVPAITNAPPNLPKSTVLQHTYDYIMQLAEENKALRASLQKAGVDTLGVEAHKPQPPLVEE